MNYYEHHLGDWAAATGHLTWDEDMAYTRLLRAYYHAEKPIPEGQQYRLAKATTPVQRRAVDAVLAEFFTLTAGAFRQARADREIERYADKQSKAKASANARWSNSNSTPNAMRTHTEINANALPSHRVGNAPNHQAPSTKHQTESYSPIGLALSAPEISHQVAVCMALRAGGIADANAGHPRLLELVRLGAKPEEFLAFLPKALDKAPGGAFAYVLACVEGARKRAKETNGQMLAGPMPNKQEALENRNKSIGETWAQGAAA